MSDVWTDQSIILEDLRKLNHFDPGSRRHTRRPNLRLLDGHPTPPKREEFEFPLGYREEYDEPDEIIEPDHDLITSSIRKVFHPYGYSNAIIEETIRRKHCMNNRSSSSIHAGDHIATFKSPKRSSCSQSPEIPPLNFCGDSNHKPNSRLNPDSKEFEPSLNKISIAQNTNSKSIESLTIKKECSSTTSFNPLVPDFIPPSVEVQNTVPDNVACIQKISESTTRNEIPPETCISEFTKTDNSKVPAVKNKKRINIAIQSILQLKKDLVESGKKDNEMNSQFDESTCADENISAMQSFSKDKDDGSRFSLSSISDDDETNEASTPTSNKISVSDVSSDDEPMPVDSKCQLWLSTNKAMISGEFKRNNIDLIVKPAAPLDLSDDAFDFKPKCTNPKSDVTENKCQVTTSSAVSKSTCKESKSGDNLMPAPLTTEEMYQLLCKQRELKNQQPQKETSSICSTPTNKKPSSSRIRPSSTNDSNWRNNDYDIQEPSTVTNNISWRNNVDEKPCSTTPKKVINSWSDSNWRNGDDDSLNLDKEKESSTIQRNTYDEDVDNGKHIEATCKSQEESNDSLASLESSFELVSVNSDKENDAQPAPDKMTQNKHNIDVDVCQSTSQGSGFSNKINENCVLNESRSESAVSQSNTTTKFTSNIAVFPTVYPQTPSDLQSPASSLSSSPPLCKEQTPRMTSPVTMNVDDVYQKLFKLKEEEQKNKNCHVGEFEKNTVWELVAPKLKKKKK